MAKNIVHHQSIALYNLYAYAKDIATLECYVSTVSIGSLYSTLKVVAKPLDINQKKAAFQDNKS